MRTDAPSALVQVRRTLDATPEELYRAWTDPDLFKRWFKPRGGSIRSVELDVRVGGRYRIAIERARQRWCQVGEYVEVDRPRRLVFTFAWESVPVPLVTHTDSRVTVEFLPLADARRTEIVVTHARLHTRTQRVLHGWGWHDTLATLQRNLTRRPAASGAPDRV
jgi:uncharacterized protein YndB with AHSA1/START domain